MRRLQAAAAADTPRVVGSGSWKSRVRRRRRATAREEANRNGRPSDQVRGSLTSSASSQHADGRGDLELSFVTKITSPKNLLKALAVVSFGFVPLLGASGCARDSATRNSISCHTLQIRDPDATPPLTPLALAAQSEPGARARARGVGPPRVPV